MGIVTNAGVHFNLRVANDGLTACLRYLVVGAIEVLSMECVPTEIFLVAILP